MGLFDGIAGGAATGAAGGPWGALIGAGIGLFGNLFGAHEQSSAASDAAKIQSEAARYEADLQAKQAAEALAFSKSQAENAYQNSESARQGNYGQWVAAQHRLGTLGQMLNLGPREIPAYVAGVDPNFSGAATPPPATAGAPAAPTAGPPQPTSNLADPSAWMSLVGNTPQLTQWVQSGLGPKADPGLVNYYVGKIKGQPGANPTEQAGSANYWMQKLKSDPSLNGGSTSAQRPQVGTIASYLGTTTPSYLTPTITPALSAPNPYGTIGSDLNG